MADRWLAGWAGLGLGSLVLLTVAAWIMPDQFSNQAISADASQPLDPAAWGSDHVGQPVPEYTTGDQCLFCHREKIGDTWGQNRHNLTIRDLDDQSPARAALMPLVKKSLVDDIKYVMGNRQVQRFLKPAKAYGQLELLAAGLILKGDKGTITTRAQDLTEWDATKFGDRCAGCHATGVDAKEKTFSSASLDCYVCHGNVAAEHTNKPELVVLSPHRNDDARVVTSICASCHVRTGKSKSSGLPYANNFVAGDNLFRDFVIGFADSDLKRLSTADRHVIENVRDVVVAGKDSVTCLSCHDVHATSTSKHQQLAKSEYCWNCHNPEGPMKNVKHFTSHSQACEY